MATRDFCAWVMAARAAATAPPFPAVVGPSAVEPDLAGPEAVGPETVGPDTVGPDAVGPDAVEVGGVGVEVVRSVGRAPPVTREIGWIVAGPPA
ncbi:MULTISPECIES: hypothetical protein [Frankia]|uniref:hypothetical protein n=1 Tax=Frankia TaxID=1854 RepID=UPI001E2A7CC6|nr:MULTISPECIES: hypothetical protein [Frankia]